MWSGIQNWARRNDTGAGMFDGALSGQMPARNSRDGFLLQQLRNDFDWIGKVR
ncbi:hypothetical protein G6N82_00750 [Altererythrobacter sp. BO-6]|uniref:hypothetical protein n=1 Tax=Altererythrobacter sp. BO-6 TaxID=2604537 RepID=UPI0013E14F23|nr:hypothetical protein [Altererythrobacter sp. BO-6]QIG52881.1 hypothetical protein G6N82_00750 [Altererythrobacter sp. BO-6]